MPYCSVHLDGGEKGRRKGVRKRRKGVRKRRNRERAEKSSAREISETLSKFVPA